MNKHAQAVEPLNKNELQSRADAERLQFKQLRENEIRTQLSEFAREFEQLKQLHKSN